MSTCFGCNEPAAKGTGKMRGAAASSMQNSLIEQSYFLIHLCQCSPCLEGLLRHQIKTGLIATINVTHVAIKQIEELVIFVVHFYCQKNEFVLR